jgi:hypothetical protein
MGGPEPGAARFNAGASRFLEDRGTSGMAAMSLMIAKGFTPEMGTKSFAIMKDSRECEVSGVPGAGVIIYAIPG